MGIEIRAVAADEMRDLVRVVLTAFGKEATEERLADEEVWAEPDRCLGAVDEGRFVASAAAYSFDLTLPGGATAPVAAVSWVGVLPTHRRQGLLTGMMRFQLEDVVARGESMAVLTASEARIYGRFGYGPATRLAKVRVDTRGGLDTIAEQAAGGRLRMIDAADQTEVARPVYDRVRHQRVGEVSRPDSSWAYAALDRESDREGWSHRFCVAHEDSAGAVDGYAFYRVKDEWDLNRPGGGVKLLDVCADDPEVESALLAFAADVDLTVSVETWARPLDDWWPLRLTDLRRYRVELIHEHLWVRILDVEAALSARTYEHSGEVVLGVDDPFRSATSGRYRLVVKDDGVGSCERIGSLHDGDADAFVGIDGLGALYLGDWRPSQLELGGRLRPSSDDALDRLDRVFASRRSPFCTTEF